jgi:acetolactate synthase-1/2/3 large subunit
MMHGMDAPLTGAECLLRSLLAAGIDVSFMNPGTSEMQFVSALDRVAGMRGILCLHETVCAGAADGYARMLGRPASALLHLGPGLANALSNLHNARKARSPVVNIIGEHATHHMAYDAPLTADIAAIARPVSDWVETVDDPQNIGEQTRRCVEASYGPPGRVASLIVPADHSWNAAGPVGVSIAPPRPRGVDSRRIREIRAILREPGCGLLLSGVSLTGKGLALASRIRAGAGVRLFANRYAGRLSRGHGVPFVERLPYFPEQAWEVLKGIKTLVTVEAAPPVSFFGYPGMRSTLAPEDCRFVTLSEEGEDALGALAELAADWPEEGQPDRGLPPVPSSGQLDLESVGQTLAALLPEDAVVVDEMVSSGEPVNRWLQDAARHELLPVTGGSIGQGLPVAVGAAVAEPSRKVVALEADGSGMYSLQALWTMARERLDIAVVIFANRRYRILEVEMQRTGSGALGPQADALMDLHRPELDWAALAAGMGVPAVRVDNAAGFAGAFREALSARGPSLVEAVLE